MFGELFGDCSSNFVVVVQGGGATYRHFGALNWEWVWEKVGVAIIERWMGRILGTMEFIAYSSNTSGMKFALNC